MRNFDVPQPPDGRMDNAPVEKKSALRRRIDYPQGHADFEKLLEQLEDKELREEMRASVEALWELAEKYQKKVKDAELAGTDDMDETLSTAEGREKAIERAAEEGRLDDFVQSVANTSESRAKAEYYPQKAWYHERMMAEALITLLELETAGAAQDQAKRELERAIQSSQVSSYFALVDEYFPALRDRTADLSTEDLMKGLSEAGTRQIQNSAASAAERMPTISRRIADSLGKENDRETPSKE